MEVSLTADDLDDIEAEGPDDDGGEPAPVVRLPPPARRNRWAWLALDSDGLRAEPIAA